MDLEYICGIMMLPLHTQFNDFPNYNKKGMKIWFFAK